MRVARGSVRGRSSPGCRLGRSPPAPEHSSVSGNSESGHVEERHGKYFLGRVLGSRTRSAFNIVRQLGTAGNQAGLRELEGAEKIWHEKHEIGINTIVAGTNRNFQESIWCPGVH